MNLQSNFLIVVVGMKSSRVRFRLTAGGDGEAWGDVPLQGGPEGLARPRARPVAEQQRQQQEA